MVVRIAADESDCRNCGLLSPHFLMSRKTDTRTGGTQRPG